MAIMMTLSGHSVMALKATTPDDPPPTQKPPKPSWRHRWQMALRWLGWRPRGVRRAPLPDDIATERRIEKLTRRLRG